MRVTNDWLDARHRAGACRHLRVGGRYGKGGQAMRVDDETKEMVIRLRKSGKKMKDIAEHCELTESCVKSIIFRAGVKIGGTAKLRYRGMVRHFWNEGLGIYAIARAIGCSSAIVSELVREIATDEEILLRAYPITKEHGANGYEARGCRCDVCRAARTQRQSRWQKSEKGKAFLAKLKGKPVPEGKHGTTYAYQTYACRCDLCRAANTDYYKRRREVKK